MRILWQPQARADQRWQLRYIGEKNPDAASRLARIIDEQVKRLADHPRIGRNGREPGTRELVIYRTTFVAIYRITPTHIDILRLLHGAQNWPPPGH